MGIGAVLRRHPDDVHRRDRRARARSRRSRRSGFNTTSVVVSVLTESHRLAAIGGAIGGVLAYLAFNGIKRRR
jgi:hypothetical protein